MATEVSPVFIDWITAVGLETRHGRWLHHFLVSQDAKPCPRGYHQYKAVEYYPSLWKHFYSPHKLDNASIIVASGAALQDMRDQHDNNWTNKVAAILARSTGHFSRIDLACDIWDGGLLAKNVALLTMTSELDFGRRTARIVMSPGEGGGTTTYIGARASPVFLRIYDKAAESKGKILASRIEFELKAEEARAVTEQLRRFEGWTLPPLIFTFLLRQFEALHRFKVIEDLLWGEVASLNILKRERLEDKKTWLSRQIKPTFTRDPDGKGGELWAWFKDMVEKEMRRA